MHMYKYVQLCLYEYEAMLTCTVEVRLLPLSPCVGNDTFPPIWLVARHASIYSGGVRNKFVGVHDIIWRTCYTLKNIIYTVLILVKRLISKSFDTIRKFVFVVQLTNSFFFFIKFYLNLVDA